ncbi:MAG: DeoR/GlpR transcriptional regulator [Clostridia bacterium]|nr:DeoR/GlpR transcriptional regulator [Clostridia bacterium]
MIPYERRERILEYLEKKPSATVRELAGELFISEASVRRDIAALEQEGLVIRHYGGVMLSGNRNGVVPVSLRDAEHSAAKEDLARRAAALIRDGDTVMMDASSTVRRMLRYLNDRRDLTIITNNLQVFSECRNPSIRLYSTGGLYSTENHALVGWEAEKTLMDFSADAVFFSSQGISEEGEITDASEAETALRRVMLSRSTRKYFLCDSSKIGVRRLFTLCHKDDLTAIIGDGPFPWE